MVMWAYAYSTNLANSALYIVSRSINNAGKPESGGLMSIVRMMNSSDVAGPISVLLKILAGMSEKK